MRIKFSLCGPPPLVKQGLRLLTPEQVEALKQELV